jgi:lysophospholipase L1-like esterase
MKISPESRVVIIGDSITDCGRARDAADDSPEALGNGYVAITNALVAVEGAARKIVMINRGVSGDTIRDLEARWDRDVLDLRPDWLVVMIGVNDVWREFDERASMRALAVTPSEYERIYDALLTRARPHLRGLVLLSPFHVQPDRTHPMRSKVEVFAGIVKRLAARHGAFFVDTQAAFDWMLFHVGVTQLAPDHVHPTLLGHTVIANALLTALR